MTKNYFYYRVLSPFKSWKNKYLKSFTRRDAQRNNLYDQAVKEVSEYTRESVDLVREKHKIGPESEQKFQIFKDQTGLDKDKVEDFYRSCSYYLYELPLWNAERNRPKYLRLVCRPYLQRNRYHKVMDFGAGAGDLCLELAGSGLEVTYCDISECLSKFAKWRFGKRNLNIKMINGADNLAGEEFDCIFSFDAFEHIKDLPRALKMLVPHLKTGGSLIFSGAFSGGTLHLEENEPYGDFKNLDRLMRSFNLVFQDKFAQFYFYKRQAESFG